MYRHSQDFDNKRFWIQYKIFMNIWISIFFEMYILDIRIFQNYFKVCHLKKKRTIWTSIFFKTNVKYNAFEKSGYPDFWNQRFSCFVRAINLSKHSYFAFNKLPSHAWYVSIYIHTIRNKKNKQTIRTLTSRSDNSKQKYKWNCTLLCAMKNLLYTFWGGGLI